MKTTTISVSRADVLRTAWQLVRKSGLSFSNALKRAWAAVKLKTAMHVKAVSFFYLKEDGTERYAIGSYRLAPISIHPIVLRPEAPGTVRYYDILSNGWRSFRIDRLILD